ncbi:hypothetical protein [Photobacterium leiognathi]|uniref:hypothetical protein n=1 Tax=Photobacterium leiognathi TaxID=553611 RepID=UPI002981CA71|nr:hypothetical protein [Photobacterium leiognathi]
MVILDFDRLMVAVYGYLLVILLAVLVDHAVLIGDIVSTPFELFSVVVLCLTLTATDRKVMEESVFLGWFMRLSFWGGIVFSTHYLVTAILSATPANFESLATFWVWLLAYPMVIYLFRSWFVINDCRKDEEYWLDGLSGSI